MDINAIIQQAMNSGGAAVPSQQGLTPSQAQPIDDQNAAVLLEQLLSQIGPAAAGPQGPRTQDPYFAEAMDVFMEENGREPATDGDFAEVEKIAVGLMQDGERAAADDDE